jgi:hypothetical protein
MWGKLRRKLFILLALPCFVGGCNTGGVVPIGPDTYMVGGLGGMVDYSGSAVKAGYFREANKYCLDRGQVMVPINSTSQDYGIGTYASAEVQFRCVNSTAVHSY